VKRLVLFNGGLKSTFLAELAKREGETMLCYFALNEREHDQMLGIGARARWYDPSPVLRVLTGAPPLEETLLRMLYLVLHAMPIAKEKQCECIYYGLSKDDDSRVVPILDAYVKQLNALALLAQPLYDGKGIWLGQIEIETPLRRLDRRRVIRLGNEWNVAWERSWSCECVMTGRGNHCGECPGCLRRREAFRLEGHTDPTSYLKGVANGKEL